jgi:hypothetical protein
MEEDLSASRKQSYRASQQTQSGKGFDTFASRGIYSSSSQTFDHSEFASRIDTSSLGIRCTFPMGQTTAIPARPQSRTATVERDRFRLPMHLSSQRIRNSFAGEPPRRRHQHKSTRCHSPTLKRSLGPEMLLNRYLHSQFFIGK